MGLAIRKEKILSAVIDTYIRTGEPIGSKALLAAIPVPDLDHKMGEIIKGEVTSPIEPPAGCRFASRCKYACDACRGQALPFTEVTPGHFVMCRRCTEGTLPQE